MLDILSYEELAAQVNTKFRLTDAPEPLDLELVEITPRKATERQEHFSLIFLGAKEPVLPQRIYSLHHQQLGAGALFLVPIGMTEQGVQYEAAFNRLLGGEPPQ